MMRGKFPVTDTSSTRFMRDMTPFPLFLGLSCNCIGTSIDSRVTPLPADGRILTTSSWSGPSAAKWWRGSRHDCGGNPPSAIERICSEYAEQITSVKYDPLLASLVFIFDFVSIHPFNDGNGRMSRLLTLLLMYRIGYDVGKYISIEKEVERTKETYYEALAASSAGWQDGESDYVPFVTHMLGVVTACYKELDSRFEVVVTPASNEESVRTFFTRLVGTATKREIMDANPGMSQRTLERILSKLQDEGVVEKVGAARATAYRSIDIARSQRAE